MGLSNSQQQPGADQAGADVPDPGSCSAAVADAAQVRPGLDLLSMGSTPQGERMRAGGRAALRELRDRSYPVEIIALKGIGDGQDAVALSFPVYNERQGDAEPWEVKTGVEGLVIPHIAPSIEVQRCEWDTGLSNRGVQLVLSGAPLAELQAEAKRVLRALTGDLTDHQPGGEQQESAGGVASWLSFSVARSAKTTELEVVESVREAPAPHELKTKLARGQLIVWDAGSSQSERAVTCHFAFCGVKCSDFAEEAMLQGVLSELSQDLAVDGQPEAEVSCSVGRVSWSVHGDSKESVYQGVACILQRLGLDAREIGPADLLGATSVNTGPSADAVRREFPAAAKHFFRAA